MPEVRAESVFREGVRAFSNGDHARAAGLFREALRIERQRHGRLRQMRYLSWLGLATSAAWGVTPLAIRACEAAAARDIMSVEMQINLGRIYLLAGRRGDAIDAFDRGLRLAPRHPALKAARAAAERRAPPAIPLLRRGHPLNRMIGRIRSRLGGSGRAPAL